jgi:TolA-binding protein
MNPLIDRRHLTVLLALGLAACAGRSVTRNTSVAETGRDEETSRTTTHLFTNRDEAALDAAREARRDGKYDEAVAGFQAVYDNGAAKSEHREQALFELGRVYADLLNPMKDFQKAAELFERFLKEFPASSLADKAREQLADLQRRMKGGS